MSTQKSSGQQQKQQQQQQQQQQQENPYDVSSLSSGAGSETLHESWLSGRFDSLPRPAQQDHDQQFAPDWPLVPVDQNSPLPVPPNNTPVVTPEDSLEDVSLGDGIHHKEDEQQLQASSSRLVYLAAPAQEARPSSFEILGCLAPVHLRQLAGTRNGRAGQHAPSRRNHGRYGLDRVPTPYPPGIVSPTTPFPGARHVRILHNPEVAAAGGHSARANQDRVASQRTRQPLHGRFGTRRLIILMVSSASVIASFVFLTQSVAIISVFRAMNKPLDPGYIVECAISVAILFPAIAGLVMVAIGRDLVFPYTLRSPFSRRQPPQPKELELDSMGRSATAGNQDVERGEVQHRTRTPLPAMPAMPAMPMPVRETAGSRVLLLEAAAPGATAAPSTTQTSIMTEMCDAVSATDHRA